jgi:ATP-binding cassette subfamily C (CFTR/MRP) protein 1
LELVKLSALVTDRGGLTGTVAASELSQGEQQLLVLARAILRKRMSSGNCILVLDEATSSIDTTTRTVIQDIIRMEFRANTVVQIAHDTDLLLDSHMVVMLDGGTISRIGTAEDIL